MKRNLKALFFFVIAVVGCGVQKSFLNNTSELKTKIVANIDLFNGIIIDSLNPERHKSAIRLYSDNDKIKFIGWGAKIKSDKFQFKIEQENNQTTLSSEYLPGRYLCFDTLVFFPNKCFRKRIYKSPNGQSNYIWEGNTQFFIYSYEGDSVSFMQNRYGAEDSLSALQSLNTYIEKVNNALPVAFSSHWILERGIDIQKSKMTFFRKYIIDKL